MSAETLARLQRSSEVQAVEGGCSGATEGMEVLAPSALLGSSGHSGSLALSPSQRSRLAPVCCCDTTTGSLQRLPHQAKVSHAPVYRNFRYISILKGSIL